MMKRMIQNRTPGILLFILLTMVAVVAKSDEINESRFRPYVGAGIHYRQMPFVEGKGTGVFKTNFLEQQVYAGVKFNDYFGLEAGYAFSTSQKKTTTFVGGQTFMDLLVRPGKMILSENRLKTQSVHLNVVGFLPVVEDSTELFLSLGIVSTQLKFQSKKLADEKRAFTPIEIDRYKGNFSATRIVPRVGVGMQHMLSTGYGVRVSIMGEKTAAFKNITSREPLPLAIRLKNTIHYQLSFFAKF